MIVTENVYIVATALAAAKALSAEQRLALRSEIQEDPADRGYKRMGSGELLLALALPYSTSNGEERRRVPVSRPRTSKEVFEWMDQSGKWLPLKRLSEGRAGAPAAAAERVLDAIRFAPALAVDTLSLLVTTGVVTRTELDAWQELEDPEWQPMIDHPSRLEAIGFPSGAVVSLAEIEEAMA